MRPREGSDRRTGYMNFQELKAIGLANPKGKIVSKDATGNDVNNIGRWCPPFDCCRDIYEDVQQAVRRLTGKPSYLFGSHETLESICTTQDVYAPGRFVFETLAPMFWFSTNRFPNWDMPFIQFDDTADPGIVLLVGTDGDVVYIDTR